MMELVDVLSRSHIQSKYHVQSDDIIALINVIRLRGELVSPHQTIEACRDPKDNRFLEAALEGKADIIVSGDADLLELQEFEAIPILSVAEFLAQF
jgi:putative PIN family toxin of toxin-antitoxin system